MHISSDRLIKSLSAVEQAHLSVCTQCQKEKKALDRLVDATQYIELVKPPENNWQELQAKIELSNIAKEPDKGEKKVFSLWQWGGAIAATVVIGLLSNLSYQQFQIQQELSELRTSNRLLENQLSRNLTGDVPQEMISQVLQIEQLLKEVNSSDDLIKQLKQRKELMKIMLEVEMSGRTYEVISL